VDGEGAVGRIEGSDAQRIGLSEEGLMNVVAVIGSRSFRDLASVRRLIADLPAGTVIVSGGAAGVDFEAERAADARGDLPPSVIFLPLESDRRDCGNCCYHRRNRRIVGYVKHHGGEIVAFSQRGKSGKYRTTPGTASTLAFAEEQRVPFRIIWDRED
jgi:hypothetical protein